MTKRVKYPRSWWDFGRLSNYPWCCIIAFHLRAWLYVDTGLLRWVWDRYGAPKGGAGYIQCPYHAIRFKLGWKPKHHKCQDCGWDQLGTGPCRIEHLHESWVVESITESYERQLSKRGYVYFRQPGRIARQVERDMDLTEASDNNT